MVLSEYASTEMSIHALYIHEVNPLPFMNMSLIWSIVLLLPVIPFVVPCSLKLHKQQSRGELSRHTWHRRESDESSDSIPDEVRSDHNPQSKSFPRSHTFPTVVSSASATSTSANSSKPKGQEEEKSQSQRRHSGPATGILCFDYKQLFHFFKMFFL